MDKIYKKSEDFVYRNIAGETILVPIRKMIKELHSIYSLNEAACRIWEMFDGRRSLNEIIELIESEYAVDRDSLKLDIKDFAGRLKEIGAIKYVK